MKKSLKQILVLALHAFSEFKRPVLLDESGNAFAPQDANYASDGYTKAVFAFNGTELRRIEKEELVKLPRNIDGSQFAGAGVAVTTVADLEDRAAPATEAPATEAPATEAPATEAPATEALATEAPATEAPATEAPATEAPATEAKPKPKSKAKP